MSSATKAAGWKDSVWAASLSHRSEVTLTHIFCLTARSRYSARCADFVCPGGARRIASRSAERYAFTSDLKTEKTFLIGFNIGDYEESLIISTPAYSARCRMSSTLVWIEALSHTTTQSIMETPASMSPSRSLVTKPSIAVPSLAPTDTRHAPNREQKCTRSR